MPYVTSLPNALIDLELDTPVISLGQNLVLNDLQTSEEFSLYDVGAGGDANLERGDSLGLIGEDESTVATGTYAGEATISTAAANVTVPNPVPLLPSLGSLNIQLNPISGSMLVDDAGNVSFVSDDPLDEDHIGVTIDFSLLGIDLPPLTANISELEDRLAEIPLLGPILSPVTNAVMNTVQDVLDTAIVNVGYDPDGTRELPPGQVVCFVAGTLIETLNGFVAVEKLAVGDMVLTSDEGYQPIRWIGSTTLSGLALKRNSNLRPVRIKAGALGHNVPSSDLLVSPQHRILVRSRIAQRMFGATEVLVPAKQLLQVEGVDYADDMAHVEYVHFLFDKHQIVLANGAETESLYTGTEALKSVGKAARAEIFELFPMLEDGEVTIEPARLIASGRQARKLTSRLIQNQQRVVC